MSNPNTLFDFPRCLNKCINTTNLKPRIIELMMMNHLALARTKQRGIDKLFECGPSRPYLKHLKIIKLLVHIFRFFLFYQQKNNTSH